jgi:hypothetical protein
MKTGRINAVLPFSPKWSLTATRLRGVRILFMPTQSISLKSFEKRFSLAEALRSEK